MTDFSNKVALVTGASRGIGKAISGKLARLGVRVVLCSRNEEQLQHTVAEINNFGGVAAGISGDVGSYEDVKRVINFCETTYGRLDILVNNAGTIEPISFLADSDPDLWSRAVDINLKGVYFCIRGALPLMLKQGAGTIINLSSGAANNALEGWSHYCSTKAGAKRLTECVHRELGDKGIRAIGLSPGTVATDMMADIKASGIGPVSQLDWSVHISPEDVGEAVAFLCTSDADPFKGTDFSLKTEEGRRLVGLPPR